MKKKNSSKLQKNLQKMFIENKRVAIITSLLVIIIIIFVAWTANAAWQDSKRFARVEKDGTVVTDKLVARLGNKVVDVQKKKVCFNTEQGPYDNGRLWCQVATVVKLNADVSYDEVGNWFIASVQTGKQTPGSSKNYGVQRYWYDSGEGMTCKLSAIDSQGHEAGGSTRVPYDEGDKPAIAIACADRAKAKHYPYIN